MGGRDGETGSPENEDRTRTRNEKGDADGVSDSERWGGGAKRGFWSLAIGTVFLLRRVGGGTHECAGWRGYISKVPPLERAFSILGNWMRRGGLDVSNPNGAYRAGFSEGCRK